MFFLQFFRQLIPSSMFPHKPLWSETWHKHTGRQGQRGSGSARRHLSWGRDPLRPASFLESHITKTGINLSATTTTTLGITGCVWEAFIDNCSSLPFNAPHPHARSRSARLNECQFGAGCGLGNQLTSVCLPYLLSPPSLLWGLCGIERVESCCIGVGVKSSISLTHTHLIAP